VPLATIEAIEQLDALQLSELARHVGGGDVWRRITRISEAPVGSRGRIIGEGETHRRGRTISEGEPSARANHRQGPTIGKGQPSARATARATIGTQCVVCKPLARDIVCGDSPRDDVGQRDGGPSLSRKEVQIDPICGRRRSVFLQCRATVLHQPNPIGLADGFRPRRWFSPPPMVRPRRWSSTVSYLLSRSSF
jgi:hypothetical protein